MQLLGVGDEYEKTKKATIRVLKDKLPCCKRVGAGIHIVYYHTIVIVSVILFLTMLIYMHHNLINLVSQLIILIMLKLYLQNGVKNMLGYWPILVFYQAIILLFLVCYYFMLDSSLN